MKHNIALLLLRIAAGISFIAHGLQKINNPEQTGQFFASLGFPAFMSQVIGYIEIIGGALLIAGLWAHIAAAVLALVIAVALFYAKATPLFTTFDVPRFEIDMALLAITISLSLLGSGRYAIRPSHGFKCACGNVCEVK